MFSIFSKGNWSDNEHGDINCDVNQDKSSRPNPLEGEVEFMRPFSSDSLVHQVPLLIMRKNQTNATSLIWKHPVEKSQTQSIGRLGLLYEAILIRLTRSSSKYIIKFETNTFCNLRQIYFAIQWRARLSL